VSIVSFGLGGDATNMIINQFSLGFLEVIIPEPPPEIPELPSGGGSAPMQPGEIQRWYKPVTEPKRPVTIKITIGNYSNDRSFLLSPKPIGLLIKVLDVINITKANIKVTLIAINNSKPIIGLKTVASKIKGITLKNLRTKD